MENASELFVIVRTSADPPELLGAWAEREPAERLAGELGPGHRVEPVPVVPTETGFVARAWTCRALLANGQVQQVDEPEPVNGAPHLVLDTRDMPAERVRVDDASAVDVAVHGHTALRVTAYAASAARARQLVTTEVRRLTNEPGPPAPA
ncbi:hypothetical protein SAMN05421810_10917 [Amycolatopsis arida]|uniref:Uncharacterized protein n=1 Tax=Amycolatopsis arida TaxID=587909 RepID=A0A1I5ZBP2_9PSEU|nr:hypothetical protein [Amycolatopsis arida]TDX89496.1 hypothetical protein CLV69_10916 [Amycolatopsis arida]SFQ53872.1 hypothetical protein SAMN05421810_10917 [Amycolatopsis arida]